MYTYMHIYIHRFEFSDDYGIGGSPEGEGKFPYLKVLF